MLSLDYVKEHISEIEFDDFIGDRRFTKRFCSFLTINEAKKLVLIISVKGNISLKSGQKKI